MTGLFSRLSARGSGVPMPGNTVPLSLPPLARFASVSAGELAGDNGYRAMEIAGEVIGENGQSDKPLTINRLSPSPTESVRLPVSRSVDPASSNELNDQSLSESRLQSQFSAPASLTSLPGPAEPGQSPPPQASFADDRGRETVMPTFAAPSPPDRDDPSNQPNDPDLITADQSAFVSGQVLEGDREGESIEDSPPLQSSIYSQSITRPQPLPQLSVPQPVPQPVAPGPRDPQALILDALQTLEQSIEKGSTKPIGLANSISESGASHELLNLQERPGLSVGRIDVIFEAPAAAPTPVRRQKLERTQGFSGYSRARLGIRA